MDNNVKVQITGNASDGITAVKEAKNSVMDSIKAMVGSLKGLGPAANENFDKMGNAAKEAANSTSTAANKAAAALEKIKVAQDHAATSAGRITSAYDKASSAYGTLTGLIVGSAIGVAAKEALYYAAGLAETAQQLGITSKELQEYRYIGSQVGIEQADMQAGLAKLTVSIGKASEGSKIQAETFNRLRISVRNSNGEIKTAGQIMPEIADALAKIPEPAERAAVEVALFGKAGQKLDNMLSGGSAQINQLRDAAHSLGIVLSEDQIANADKTADRLDELKQVLAANIAGAVSNNANAIYNLANSLTALAGGLLKFWNQNPKAALGIMGAMIGGRVGGLPGAAAGAVAGVVAGSYLQESNENASNDIGLRRAKLADAHQRYFEAKSHHNTSAMQHWRPIMLAEADRTRRALTANGASDKPAAPIEELDTSFTPNAVAGGSSPKDDRVGGWEAKLEEEKLAHAKMQDEQGSFQEFSVQREAEYWNEILQRHDLTAKERLSVTRNYLAADQEINKRRFESHIADLKAQFDAAKDDGDKRVQLAEQMAREIGDKYGLESREYIQAQAQIVRAKEEAAEQIKRINLSLIQSERAAALAGIQAAEDQAEFQVELGLKSSASLLRDQKLFEQQRYQAQLQALNKSLALETKDKVAQQQLLAQKEQLAQAHNNKLLQLDRKLYMEKHRLELTSIKSLASSWSQNLARMLTFQQSFSDTVAGLWQGLVGVVTGALGQMIEAWLTRWLTSLIIGKAAQGISALSQIMSYAAVAGAAAYASTAAIPIIGPMLAPAAAATAYAATAAFAPAAAAEKGFDVPAGVNPVTQLHQKEMVLPAKYADIIRGMEGGRGGGGGAPNIYVQAIDAKSFERILMDNKSSLAKALRKYARDGGR